jgi:micrococcal nuclease
MYEYNCKLRRVVDGDTIDVEVDLGFDVWVHERVRMYGINTPESRTTDLWEKELGKAAKTRLLELLPNTFKIKTQKDAKGKFGRILGVVEVDGRNINEQLITEGHAVAYHGGAKPNWREIKGVKDEKT